MEPFKEREELKMLSGKFLRKIIRKKRIVRSKRIFERVVVVGGIILRHVSMYVLI